MTWLALAIVTVLINFLFAELFDLFPWLSRQLIRWAVRVLPPGQRDRYEAEWLAELDALPGRHLPRLFFALTVLLTSPRTRAALQNAKPGRFGQRAFDLVVVILFLGFLLPGLAVIACVIRASRPRGRVLERSPRVAPNGRQFELLTFRTPRGLLGDVLRATSLNEMPQLINVALGDMSLIGPRPMRCGIEEAARPPSSRRRKRNVKAGVVSWTALRDDEEGRRRDRELVDHWSLFRALHLLAAVVLAGLKDRRK